jgi:hypothetical protein
MLDTGNRGAGGTGVVTPNTVMPGTAVTRTWPRHVRSLGFALVVTIVVAAGALAYLVLVIVPSADAAGGCGGG